MKNLNTAILIALGMTLPLTVMASPDDDVTIRMMEANEHAVEAVTSHIELPESADDHAREHAANGLETANNDHSDKMDKGREHDMDDENRDHEAEREENHEREMDREEEHEREMETERDDRKDVEHGGIDREEVEHDGIDHDRENAQPEIEIPDRENTQPETEAPDRENAQSSHGDR